MRPSDPHLAERQHVGAELPEFVIKTIRTTETTDPRRGHGEGGSHLRRERTLPRHGHEHLLDAAEKPAARDVHGAH